MEEESIYNLIPKEYVPAPKQPLYRSRFSHTVPPTASTFCLKTTSVPKVANVNGDFEPPQGPHVNKAAGATFGKPKGAVKPDTKSFTKKGTGKMGCTTLPEIKGTFKYEDTFKKPPIPKRDEKPIMGLTTTKNYIVANAVENMLAQPKVIEEPMDWTKKKTFGKVPKYLERIKEQTLREYEHIRSLHQQEQEQQDTEKFLLSEEELNNLREGLKKKWEIVNKEYQLLTHKAVLDTVGLKRKKEECEKELAQIERDLEKLHKDFIFVDTTQ